MYKVFTAREGPGWFLPCPPPGPHQINLRKTLHKYTKINKTRQTPNELQVNIRFFQHIRGANGHWAMLDCSCMRDLCGIYAGSMREMQASACWPAPFCWLIMPSPPARNASKNNEFPCFAPTESTCVLDDKLATIVIPDSEH